MNQQQGVKRSSLVACAVAGLFLAACNRDNSQDHLARAKELSAKNDHRGAVIELKNSLQGNSQLAEARFLLGRALLEQGDPRNAEIELQKAYDQKYDPDLVLPLLVKSQMLQGQLEKVVKQVPAAGVKSPIANAELQSLLGLAQFGQGKADEAMTAFASAKQFVPDYPAAVLGEARVTAARGDLAGASAQVGQILAKNPKQVEGLLLKGDIARARGAPKEAIAAYEGAIQEDPRNFIARLSLAGAYIGDSQPDLAQKQIDELKKISPRHPGVNYLDALIAFNKKDFTRANDSITLSLAAMPNNGAAQLLAGAVATATNQPAQAEQHLRDALKSSPNNLFTRKLLTSLYLRQRQAQKADEILQPAITAAPDDPALVSLAGEVALLRGDFKAASRSFEQATKLNPSDANVRTQSAAVQFARGDSAAGFAELEAASKVATTNPNPDIALILAHVQRRQFDQALTAWKTLQKRQPDNPLTYNLRAAIDIGKNDSAAARLALEKALQLQPNYFPAIANLAGLDLRDKKVESARQRYKNFLAKEPGNLSGLLALAQLENSTGASADTVLGLLKEAKRSNPNSEQAVAALVAYYMGKQDPKQALGFAQDALASSPNNPRYLDMVGQLMLQTGSADQAVAAYRKLVSLNPEAIEYQLRLGQAQLTAGQSEAALQSFTSALKLKPASIEAQSAIVGSMIRAGKGEEAGRILAEIKTLAPKSPAIPELEADVKFAMKQYPEAAAIYRKTLSQVPTSDLVIKTYSSLSLAGKRTEADAFMADWLKNHPKDYAARIFDADVALRSKEYVRAAQNFRAVLEVQPNDPLVLNNLAWSLWQQKDPQALGYAEKANAMVPGNPAISDTLGWMLVEQGQTKRGLELLEKASAAAPAQRDIAMHLAKAQIKDGRKDAARATLQSLVKTAPDSAEGKESKELLTTL